MTAVRKSEFRHGQPGLPELTPIERQVYEMCYAAAEEGRELDSSEAMQQRIGASSYSTVPGILKRLEAKGWITRSIFQRGRSVCIVATGKCTASPSDTTPHWRVICNRSKDSTPTLPKATISNSVPTLMDYLDRMMRDENLSLPAAQLVLMSRGMQHREQERGQQC